MTREEALDWLSARAADYDAKLYGTRDHWQGRRDAYRAALDALAGGGAADDTPTGKHYPFGGAAPPDSITDPSVLSRGEAERTAKPERSPGGVYEHGAGVTPSLSTPGQTGPGSPTGEHDG